MEFYVIGKTVYLKREIGVKTDFQFRYRLNIRSIEKDIDTSKLATVIRGYAGEPDDNGVYPIEEEYISPNINYIGRLETDPYTSENMLAERLKSKLKEVLIDEPQVSLKIDFVDLRASGYNQGAPSEGDYGYIIYEPMNDLNIEARIVEIEEEYNGRVEPIRTSVVISNIRETATKKMTRFQQTQRKINDLFEGKQKLPYSALDNAVRNATEALLSTQTELEFNNGLIAREKTNPNSLVVLNSAGLGVSKDGGYSFRSAITGDGIVADVINSGTLSSINVNSVNIYGSYIESSTGNGKVVLADGEIKSFINNERVMSLDSDGLKMWSDFNFIAGTLRGRKRSNSKFGIELMAHREYLSLGFRVTGTQIIEPWFEMSRDAETNYTSIYGGNRDGSDWGDLRLYSSGGRYLGNGGGVPRTEIRNYNTDLKWGGIMNFIGRDYDAQDRDDERFSYEIWQYDGTGDRASTQLFKVDRKVTNIYSQQAYLPDQTFLKTSNNQYDNALGIVLNNSIRVHGDPSVNINPILSAYEINVTYTPGSGYSIMR